MLVVVRSGISASRGYGLVATQNQAQNIELENERLRVEIAQLKSPQRIKEIAETQLGMKVPPKMYFSHER
ncbi:MAG: cell division protein FtsL [Selenomonadaceae bacterium]|nr:cell division protein FtsL [Selenomonadaceae bacterium]